MALSKDKDKKVAKPGVKLDDLYFYFDAVDRDRIDGSGRDRRASELLALRERLLKMPEPAFEAAIKTIRSVVESPADADDAPGSPSRRKQATTLYEEARGPLASSGAVSKITGA